MTRSVKPRFQAWDVVVVPFPFSDQQAAKVRPALIVSTEALGQSGKYFLAMITSAAHAGHAGDVLIRNSDSSLATRCIHRHG